MRKWILFIILLFAIILSHQAGAYETNRTFTASQVPHELKGITVDEKLGEYVNLDLKFTDENGKKVTLRKYADGTQPVIFTIIYYMCPNLCQLHLNGLVKSIHELKIKGDFQFVALSMDHTEKPSLAKKKMNSFLRSYELPEQKNWHFLTGAKSNIKKVSKNVGFNFKWNKEQKQYAHLPVAYILTPKGQISRYLYGIEMDEKTLRLSLTEASNGRVGGIMERILLFCFQFDPRKNRYTLYAYNLMQAAGIVTVILLLLLLVPIWFRKQKL